MKTGKEYPATHSMSTSWYAIDAEGNVAVIGFEDNGPVPVGVPESSEEEIIYDIFSDKRDKIIARLPYTPEEVDKMLADAQETEFDKKDIDLDTCIVRVDMSRFDEFSSLAREEAEAEAEADEYGERQFSTFCLDWERGFFYLDWYYNNPEIEAKIIAAQDTQLITPLKTLDLWQYDSNPVDVLRDYPFYVYRQDYNSLIPLRRTVIPEKPFTEDRLPVRVRERAIHLPLRFKDAESIQIAQYALSDVHDGPVSYIDNRKYVTYQMPDGSFSHIAESSIITEVCGETCTKCCPYGVEGANPHDFQRSKEPTVFVIKDLKEIHWTIKDSPEYYLSHSVFISLIRSIPCSHRVYYEDNGREIKKHPVKQHFEKCRIKLEANMAFFNPHTVLIYREVIPFLEEYYPMEGGMIRMGEQSYPFFVWEDREKHLSEIDELAHLPYRGGQIHWVIPLTEEEKTELAKYYYI